MEQLTGSVGLMGTNLPTDVRWVQNRLNVHRPSICDGREIVVDGIVGPATIDAIRAFQLYVLKNFALDGRVDPGGPTFLALRGEPKDSSVPPVVGGSTTTVITGALRFPLRRRPAASYVKDNTKHRRYFGADRDGGKRRHAGCDLLAPVGTEILAIADGTVTGHSPHFYKGTHALEVAHNCKLLARYCELKGLAPGIKIGSSVKKGQVIAYVGKLPSNQSMLHFELYSNASKGPLTVRDASSPSICKDKLFQRRADLLDPTSYLNKATTE